jgi:ADP-ribosylglycohydrolase
MGAFFANDPEKRREFVLASSRLTHRSWQAEMAAMAVAEYAALAMWSESPPNPVDDLSAIRDLSHEKEWRDHMSQVELFLKSGASVADFACVAGLTKGVTGYSLHVVPVALYAWLRHNAEFRSSVSEAIACGGDTDTVGAIVGALCGCTTGTQRIPAEWRNNIWEWPRSLAFVERLGGRLAEQKASNSPLGPVPYFCPGQIPRNVLFFMVVLAYGFRRFLP